MSEFDKHIREQAGNYGKQPGEHVWRRISDELDGKKKRRLAFWLWWMVPLVLAGGSAMWLIDNNKQSQEIFAANNDTINLAQDIQQNIESQSDKKQIEKKLTTQPNNSKSAPIAAQVKIEPATSKNNTKNALPGPGNADKISPLQQRARLEKANPQMNAVAANSLVPTPTPTPSTHTLAEKMASAKVVSDSFNEALGIQTNINKTLPEIQAKEDEYYAHAAVLQSIAYQVASPNTFLMEPTPLLSYNSSINSVLNDNNIPDKELVNELNNAAKKVVVNRQKSTANWNLIAGVGMHNLKENSFGLKSSLLEYNAPLPNNMVGGQFGNLMLQPPKPGAGFMLGVERLQPIAKAPRWSWLAGVHYQYQTMEVVSGARRDSALQFADASNSRSESAAYYLVPGNTLTQQGNQHRIMLQAGLQWKLHKNGKWLLQGTSFAGLNVHHNYWLPQSRNVGWVPSKGLVSRGFAGLESGFSYRPSQWGLGVFVQYTFTPASNFNNLPKQYWRGVELRFHHSIFQKSSK